MLRIFHNTSYGFVRWWRQAAIATAVFIAAGLATFAITGGVNYSIEFTGGTLMQVRFTQAPDVAVVRSALDQAGITGAEIQQFGSPTEFTIRARDERQVEAQAAGAEGIAKSIQAALDRQYGAGAVEIVRTEAVGPKVR
jgi:preprotein translocase subunit SecF